MRTLRRERACANAAPASAPDETTPASSASSFARQSFVTPDSSTRGLLLRGRYRPRSATGPLCRHRLEVARDRLELGGGELRVQPREPLEDVGVGVLKAVELVGERLDDDLATV